MNADMYLELLLFTPQAIISLVFIIVISLVINGMINKELIRGLGINLDFREAFVLAASATFANQLPISGGLITRAFYLKQKYKLTYTKFISVNLALFICFVSANGFIGVLILLYWMLYLNIVTSFSLFIGFGLMIGFLLVFLLPLEKINLPPKFKNQMVQAMDGWKFIRKNPGLLARIVLLQIIITFLLAIRYYLVFTMMSQEVRGGEVLLFSAASVLTQMVSIAPGGLGILEAIVGGVAAILDFDLGVSIVALGIDRLISTLVIFVVGGVSSIILSKQITDLPMNNDQQEDNAM